MNAITTALPDSTLRTINAAGDPPVARQPTGLGAMDQGDFLTLMLAQLQQQDPLEPVDNTQMLAQMAQFTALAGTTETNATLGDISAKLDALIAAQQAVQPAA
ncbi:flagellar hook assembly protein FlgD [Erythrobacter sp. EC-HK427]|uniref:flagellar hook assembly protein FlgD n=1 Tax=Erythrobacter sp. EC-HK427 TaxID=2038396 RepID=UPI001F433FE4|nr:flagellar hook capping FlgD N-terminal domain-containing protein [Erythrobacter sp. EC-HK427]